MAVIEAVNLTKVYRVSKKKPGVVGAFESIFRPHYAKKTAVDGLCFRIEEGEMVGYIGINGAGKSTTIKLLTGILAPTSGTIRVLNRDPHHQRIANARDIGVVFGQRTQLWWDVALIESLNLISHIYDIKPERYQRLLAQFTDMLDLGPLLHVPVRAMSLGQKMRAELAATFIHEPRIVYLDEPTIGLDMLTKDRVRELVKFYNREQGVTVMLTTHDLGDIEELCQRVIIIDAGKLLYDGRLSTIRERFGTYRTITFETNISTTLTCSIPYGAEIVSQDANKLVLRFDRLQTTASQVASEIMRQIEVVDFSLTEPDLSSIIRHLYTSNVLAEVPA